jgi:hypothetical protein
VVRDLLSSGYGGLALQADTRKFGKARAVTGTLPVSRRPTPFLRALAALFIPHAFQSDTIMYQRITHIMTATNANM